MSKIEIKLTCGSCSGLNRERLVSTKEFCAGMGKIPSSNACSSHKPDVFSLINDEPKMDMLGCLADVTFTFSIREMQVLASLLLNEKKTRRAGYRFWQKVYVRIGGTSGDNYFNNFAIARVLDANKEYVRLVSETVRTSVTLVNDKDSESLFTVERFKPIREEMIEKKRYVDPKTREPKKFQKSPVLPTLDFASDTGLLDDANKRKNKKLKKSERSSLIDLVGKMAKGNILSKRPLDFDGDELVIDHV